MCARPRIGLIGCGRIGKVHLRSLLSMPDLAELAMLVDAHEPSVRETARQFGVERWSTRVEDIFGDSSISGVVIASSTDTHGPFIVEAAKSGKAAFTEKPIALDLQATDVALNAVRSAGTQLQIGFQRHFDAGYVAARERIASGGLGAIEFVRDAMRDPEPPPVSYVKVSGGLFRDMTIHNFDCVRWLMGSDPESVFAAGGVLISPEFSEFGDIDTGVVLMRWANGAMATIENSRRSGFGYDVRTEVFGSGGAVFVGESRATPNRLFDAQGVHEDHQYFFLDRFGAAFSAEMRGFAEAIRDDTPVRVSGEDGRAALLLAYAAEESLRTGVPVSLSAIAKKT